MHMKCQKLHDMNHFAFKVALNFHGHAYYTQTQLGPVPLDIKIYKAMNYMALTRPFKRSTFMHPCTNYQMFLVVPLRSKMSECLL